MNSHHKLSTASLTTISCLLLGLTAASAQQVDKATLATQIAEGRKQNMMMMQEYSWNTRTEVKIDGEVKSLKVDMVRYTADGELQKTKISDSADSQKKMRGVKGKVAQKKIKGMKEWAGELGALLQKYSLPTTGNLVDFMEKATMSQDGALAVLTASNVVQQGDQMTIRANPVTKQLKAIEVATSLDGDDVQVEITNDAIEGGPSYSAQQIVKVPAQKVELKIENFNFQKQ